MPSFDDIKVVNTVWRLWSCRKVQVCFWLKAIDDRWGSWNSKDPGPRLTFPPRSTRRTASLITGRNCRCSSHIVDLTQVDPASTAEGTVQNRSIMPIIIDRIPNDRYSSIICPSEASEPPILSWNKRNKAIILALKVCYIFALGRRGTF
jgi:hypothetical protein